MAIKDDGIHTEVFTAKQFAASEKISDVPTVFCHAHFKADLAGVSSDAPAFFVSCRLRCPSQAERTQKMKIKYKFANGETSEVEVNDEVGTFIIKSRKEEHALDEKERYHREFSIEQSEYEGLNIAIFTGPDDEVIKNDLVKKMDEALDCLTETQRRRLLMYSEGMSMRAIAQAEGISNHHHIAKSIEEAKKKIEKFI